VAGFAMVSVVTSVSGNRTRTSPPVTPDLFRGPSSR
jgi:hypothetical protein